MTKGNFAAGQIRGSITLVVTYEKRSPGRQAGRQVQQ